MRRTYSLNGSDWQILGLMPTEWVWRKIGEAGTDLDALRPATPAWIPAQVPGDVVSDLRDAGEIPDPWFDRNSRACEWVSQRDWVYRKEFVVPQEMCASAHFSLRFGGVDHACHVFLNGTLLGDHVGLNAPFSFDVTAILNREGTNTLLVVIDHAPSEPEVQGQIGWTNRIRQWKPRFVYDWDWCTRLIPLGIWQEVALESHDGVRIEDLWVRPHLRTEENGTPDAQAEVRAEFRLRSDTAKSVTVAFRWEPDDSAEREPVSTTLTPGRNEGYIDFTIPSPRLWYPNGSGEQNLYSFRITVGNEAGEILDEREERFGIREAVFVPNDDAPEDALPYVLQVNGVKIFIKGWNWVPIDQLYGRPHEEKYRHWIRLAKEAHCNLLRVWGGGYLERKQFYDLCDEAGIFVWQEFSQSSSGIDNEPAQDQAYLDYCRDQARKMIVQRRNHPSLLLWCGGNELMTPDWKPLGNDHPTIAALREVVQQVDPGRPFLPTSPSGPTFGASMEAVGKMHDVHGDWTYGGDPKHYTFYNTIDPLLHSEFGVPGAANIEAFTRFLPPEAHWPPDRTNPNWVHHGSWWLNRDDVTTLFGEVDHLPDFVKASQWIQAEGLRYAVEANRRRKWRTSGAIPWQFNEAWPNVSCTNAVDYYGQPKPAYWWIRRAYAPCLVSARYEKLQWKPGETFTAEIHCNRSEGEEAALGGKIHVRWQIYDVRTGGILAEDETVAPVAALVEGHLRMATIRYRLPRDYQGVFALRLGGAFDEGFDALSARQRFEARQSGRTIERNEYLFSTAKGAPFADLLHLPAVPLQVRHVPVNPAKNGRIFAVRNVGEAPALHVAVSLPDAPLGILPDSNYRTLLPNEIRWFHFGSDRPEFPDSVGVSISAWNAPPRRLRL